MSWMGKSSMRRAALAASNTFFASYQWTAQPRASAAAASALRLAVHHPVGVVLCPVVFDPLGNSWWQLWAVAKRDAQDVSWHRHHDGFQVELRVPFRRHPHTLHQCHCLIKGKPLPFAVVGNLRKVLVHQFDAATVEERSVARNRHQHSLTAVIRYPDDPVVLRHDFSSG